MNTSINNKEYLKKYLSLGKAPGEKKKKKKRQKGISTGLKIVDDDIPVDISEEIRQDLDGDAEDAPQIASIIDDRPPSLRIDEVTHTKLWKPIGEADDFSAEKAVKLQSGFKLNKAQPLQLPKTSLKKLSSNKKLKHSQDDDFSPPRVRIKQERRSPSLDNSPPRLKKRNKNSPSPRNRNVSTYISPPRRIKIEDVPPPKDSDISPARKGKHDTSPKRRENLGRDISPPRRIRRGDLSPSRKNKRDSDISPPRKKNHADEDFSPPRRKQHVSPPRKSNRRSISPPSRRSMSPSSGRRRSKDKDISPRRKRKDSPPTRAKKSRWNSAENGKMAKTLEGKTAGLQNAEDLARETAEMKFKNDEIFKNMSADTSGKNAATIVRNSIRNKKKEVDPEEEERKRIREEQNKAKYDKWGKGLKQVEAQNIRIEEITHEMNKPLARYADDQDLENYLRDQEREGDPMLAYMRKKKKRADVEAGKPVRPQYEGEFAINRFGIPPGYRWDGVDRSNGYEKKYFEVQNKRRADVEEAFKWSTEDM